MVRGYSKVVPSIPMRGAKPPGAELCQRAVRPGGSGYSPDMGMHAVSEQMKGNTVQDRAARFFAILRGGPDA